MEAVLDRPLTIIDDDEIVDEGGNEDDARFGYCYYRLKTGWIMQGRADPSSIETYKKKGCEALVDKYGRFVLNPAIRKDAKGNPVPQWQPYAEPYDKLLLEAPGEFPPEQLIAYQWHKGHRVNWIEYLPDGSWRRHRKTVTFPQLAGLDIPEDLCTLCGRVFTGEFSKRDLNTHTRVAHPEQGTILKLAETQQAIANAITTAQGAGGSKDEALMLVLQQVMATQAQMGEVLAQVVQNQRAPGVRPTKDASGRFTGSLKKSDPVVPDPEPATGENDAPAGD